MIHAGIYHLVSESPLKARLCVEGNPLYMIAGGYNVPHKKTGKLVVASSKSDIEYLEDSFQNRI